MSKIIITFIFLNMLSLPLTSQTTMDLPEVGSMTIDQCYEWSRENYPLYHHLNLINKTTEYNVSNASKGKLPQVNLNGQATYQSDVTSLPIKLLNTEIPSLDKDQYKIYGEAYQSLTNFSQVNTLKEQIEKNSEIEKQEVEINLYNLRDRINQIYFGTLLIDEKIAQLKIIQVDLDSAIVKIQAGIENGTATLTDKNLLNVERISLDQKVTENRSGQHAFTKMLAALTGKNITLNTQLIKPNTQSITLAIDRPELLLFGLQNESIILQERRINQSIRPVLGLFIQGGYGRPALNFLSNEFEPFFIGGLKFNWNLSNLYRYKNSIASLKYASAKIDSQKEAFLLNTRLTQSQQSLEVTKYESLLESDLEIIQIRADLLTTAKVQLSNGLITTIDYIKFVNDLNTARQTMLLHETQLLLAQYNLKNTNGQ